MYPIKPLKAFVDASVNRDPRWTRRADVMVQAMGNPPVEQITPTSAPDLVRANQWTHVPTGTNQLGPGEEPIVVLNTFRFDEDGGQVDRMLRECPEGTSRGLVERLVGHWGFDQWSTSIRGGEQVCRRGYYDGWATGHHARWVWHTKSHNCVTLSDAPQGMRSPDSRGAIENAFEDEKLIYSS